MGAGGMGSNQSQTVYTGSFSTGRLVALAVLLVAGGLAAPRIRDIWALLPGGTGKGVSVSGRLTMVENAARTITTRERMKGVKEALKLWSAQHGAPDENSLVGVVGKETATDGWGRRIRYAPPNEGYQGCLRSFGPDGVRSKDDIVVIVTWKDVDRKPIAPAWQ
jgi:hypothetical protein